MGFYRKLNRENRKPSDFLKDDSTAKIAQFKWATIPQFSPFFKGIKSKKSEKCLKNQNKIKKIP